MIMRDVQLYRISVMATLLITNLQLIRVRNKLREIENRLR